MGILCIVLAVVLIVLFANPKFSDGTVVVVGGICVCLVAAGLGIMGYTSFKLINGRDIGDRIAMYEEQNAKIEEQVATAVQVYMDHENLVFDSATPDSYITLVSLYPDLKSDSLMQRQIDIYISNNEKICELKEENITLQRAKFWLYFGR